MGVDGVVFGPGRFDGTGEGEDAFVFMCGRGATDVEEVIGGGRGGVPVFAVFDGVPGVLANVSAGIGIIGGAADVFEAPMEGLDAAIVVGGPAAVLVAADSAFEPVHEEVDS